MPASFVRTFYSGKFCSFIIRKTVNLNLTLALKEMDQDPKFDDLASKGDKE